MLDMRVEAVGDRVARVVAAIAAQNRLAKTIGRDDGLVDSGLSSIAMVDLMLAIETEFDLTIPQADLTPETFRSIASIEAVMTRLVPVRS